MKTNFRSPRTTTKRPPDFSNYRAAGLVSGGDGKHAAELVEALCDPGAVLAFVGSGVSTAAGLPSWNELLRLMHGWIDEDLLKMRKKGQDVQLLPAALLEFTDDPLWRAEEYQARAGSKFLATLARAIRHQPAKAPRNPKVLENVVRLPFDHFLTTNFDATLEEAAAALGVDSLRTESYLWGSRPQTAVALARLREKRRHVIHIHGMLDHPESMILANSHYAEFYLGTDRHAKQLFSILANYRICFLGFSLTDPHVLRVLEQVQALGYEGARHFAVMPDPGPDLRGIQRRMFQKRFGVAPIYYRLHPTPGEEYRNFPHLLALLVEACAHEKARRMAPPKEVRHHPQYWPARKQVRDPEDPNLGRFGRREARDGVVVRAEVRPFPNDPEWFDIDLTVQADPIQGVASLPLRDGQLVKFHLHPTFRKKVVSVKVRKGVAKLNRYAWGAFVVGIELPGRTCLEIDLSKVPKAPAKFRGR